MNPLSIFRSLVAWAIRIVASLACAFWIANAGYLGWVTLRNPASVFGPAWGYGVFVLAGVGVWWLAMLLAKAVAGRKSN